MNDHLLRCRCASAPHVPTAYAPVRCSRRLASGALLRHLQGAYGRISTRAVGAPRFLNRLQQPNTPGYSQGYI